MAVLEAETVKLNITDEKVEVKGDWSSSSFEDVEVYISYFWNAHGKLIPWQVDGKVRRKVQAKWVQYRVRSFTLYDQKWTEHLLYIDDKCVGLGLDKLRWKLTQYSNGKKKWTLYASVYMGIG